ncbi:unnamed protein product, partial [Meganyctiphanes norvegica]
GPSKQSYSSQCLFPFTYKSVTYYVCTKVDSKVAWCAAKIDTQRRVTKAIACHDPDSDESKLVVLTESGSECHLPFNYQGMWHFGCIKTPNSPRPWCATQ